LESIDVGRKIPKHLTSQVIVSFCSYRQSVVQAVRCAVGHEVLLFAIVVAVVVAAAMPFVAHFLAVAEEQFLFGCWLCFC
jgi:hypothetical protein